MPEQGELLDVVAEAVWMGTGNYASRGTPYWAAPAGAKEMCLDRAQQILDHIEASAVGLDVPQRCKHFWLPIHRVNGQAWCPNCDEIREPPAQ